MRKWTPQRKWTPHLFAALLLAAILQLRLQMPGLPDRMALNFDGQGLPNSYSDKSSFALVGYIMYIGLAFCFGFIRFLIARMPVKYISMPHRDYWLAPERRAQTLADLNHALTWFGCVAAIFMMVMMQLTIQANTGEEVRLSSGAWIAMGSFGLYTLIWTVRMMKGYNIPD